MSDLHRRKVVQWVLGYAAVAWTLLQVLEYLAETYAWLPASAGGPIKHAVPTDAPSVAVLPFVNLSSDPEQEYFSDGLSEEILNALARTPGLYVPARTSSFQSGDTARPCAPRAN